MTMEAIREILEPLGGIPNDYLVFDLETTGVDNATDLITQCGFCLVRNRKPVEQAGVMLNWCDQKLVDQGWLTRQLDSLRYHMEKQGKTMQTTVGRLHAEGEDPVSVLEEYYGLLTDAIARGEMLVGHNSWNFDRRFMAEACRRWLPGQPKLDIPPNGMLDTGMIEKAIQINSIPWPGDTLKKWASRVGGIRAKGVKWNLDFHSVPKYDLAAKHNLDMAEAHDAGFDCYLTHLLLEEYRQLAGMV